jgi:hypothetical protein
LKSANEKLFHGLKSLNTIYKKRVDNGKDQGLINSARGKFRAISGSTNTKMDSNLFMGQKNRDIQSITIGLTTTAIMKYKIRTRKARLKFVY